jgi:hypothetical protein
MTTEFLDSSYIATLDTQPISMLTTGEGASGVLKCQTDTVAYTASGVTQAGSTYRLCRIPTSAKIKQVFFDAGEADTAGTAAVTWDINLAFSDSTFDFTQVVLQSLIPTSALTGATTTTALYSSPNKIFGNVAQANTAAISRKDVTFNGTLTNWLYNGPNLPLWNFFGFTNSQGYAQDPGGFFDFLVYVAHLATTPAAGSLAITCYYVL